MACRYGGSGSFLFSENSATGAPHLDNSVSRNVGGGCLALGRSPHRMSRKCVHYHGDVGAKLARSRRRVHIQRTSTRPRCITRGANRVMVWPGAPHRANLVSALLLRFLVTGRRRGQENDQLADSTLRLAPADAAASRDRLQSLAASFEIKTRVPARISRGPQPSALIR